MFAPLRVVFQRVVSKGDLTVVDASGVSHQYGDGSGKPLVVRLGDRKLELDLIRHPQLALGEAYMDGRFIVEKGTIYDFLELVLKEKGSTALPLWAQVFEGLRFVVRRFQQFNPAFRARRNVAHHYDIDGAIYDLFLDSDRQYSCAYFEHPDASLEEAQRAKKRHLASKLALGPGQRVLDIGSGWGGLGLYLAKIADVEVKGITLSREQLEVSRRRAMREGLAKAVRFELEDYRDVEGPFDRIVSVGMFEHVGVNHYGTFFRQVRDLLTDDGVALIHSIGRFTPPCATNAFIAKYIFPGGYVPALSEVLPAIQRSGLFVTDVEILRLHYAETLRHWRERFRAAWHEAVEARDERFCRMWEFYLSCAEVGFRHDGLMVFQLQLTKRIDTLPITRDYMWREEERLRDAEAGRLGPQRLAGE